MILSNAVFAGKTKSHGTRVDKEIWVTQKLFPSVVELLVVRHGHHQIKVGILKFPIHLLISIQTLRSVN